MKKILVSSAFAMFMVSTANANQCEHSTMLKVGGIGAAVGAAAALVIPGVGPVISTGILAGTSATTVNVAACAYDKHERKQNNATYEEWRDKAIDAKKNVVLQANLAYGAATNKLDEMVNRYK